MPALPNSGDVPGYGWALQILIHPVVRVGDRVEIQGQGTFEVTQVNHEIVSFAPHKTSFQLTPIPRPPPTEQPGPSAWERLLRDE